MPGPPPKDPRIRRRGTRASTRSTLPSEAESARRKVPPLPKWRRPWRSETRAWWKAVWKSPMADQYLGVDFHGLLLLATLVDSFWRAPDPKLAAEIRLQGQSFGLGPIDRRRLGWTIAADEGAGKARTRRRRRPADPRRVLEFPGTEGA